MSQFVAVFWTKEKAGIVPAPRRAEKTPEEPNSVGLHSVGELPVFFEAAQFFGQAFLQGEEFLPGDDRKAMNLKRFLVTSDFLCKLHRNACTRAHRRTA